MSGRRLSSSFRVGTRVEYTVLFEGTKKKVSGTIAYGPGQFHLKPNENDWCGVILDEPYGKNNGTIQGKQYFECAENCGVFVRSSTLRPLTDHSRIPVPKGLTKASPRSTPSSTPKSMTPSSSMQSFTGMFDSGGDAGSAKMTESVNLPPTAPIPKPQHTASRIRPPTDVLSSAHESSNKLPPSGTSIRQLVEKIETKRDEMIKEDDAAQDISQNIESQTSTPTHNSKVIQELNDKIKDLESKLNTLMVKRAEDRQKFKEFERLKIQNEQLLENKKQMAEKIAELSKQKAVAEKEAQDAREEQKNQSEEIRDLVDNAEMAVIEKEMAENKAEQLQIELDQCKEQLEEARLDFEILKTEIEDKGVDGAANSFVVKKLEEQNSRYKDALLKLRDISAADRSSIQIMQKDLEQKNQEINNLIQLNDKQKTELEKCLEQIEDLKEQVDMALGSQEMVEKLTEKNLAIEDKCEELQKALDEEENIKELSNMIIEEKDEMIADLRDEVDRYKTNLVNLRNSFVVSQEAIQDHESTIRKFRELVAMLKEENSMLRAAQEQDLNKVQHAVDVQKQLENIEFKTRLLDRRDLSRAIDMELRQLDIDQCYRHMVYLARFFPESFFTLGGDHDSIAVLLYIPRMYSKCFIIERQIIEKYTSVDGQTLIPDSFGFDGDNSIANQSESTDKLKQQIFSKHIIYLLTSIRSTLDKYQEILTKCDSDLFIKLGSLYPELSSHEKNVDHFLDLLREDKLDENVSLDSLEKILSYLQSLYNIYMASSNLEPSNDYHNKFLNDLLDVLRTGTEASILDLKIMTRMVSSDSSMVISSMETSLNDIEQFGKKIRRRMVSAGSGSSDVKPACLIRFPSTVEAELLDSFHNFSLTVRSLKTIRSVLMTEFFNQLTNKNSNEDGGEDSQQKNVQFSMDDLERICKEWTGNSIKSLSEMLTNVMSSICKFCTIIQQGDYDVSKTDSSDSIKNSVQTPANQFQLPASFQNLFSSNISNNQRGASGSLSQNGLNCLPLDQRAMIWRQQTEQIQDFRQKIQTQESDINELKRALKAKIDEVSEMQIRRDLSEKKHKEALKDNQKLQDELERLTKEFKEKEAERERTLNKYNQEINELYSDHRIMKEKLKDYSKNALLGKMLMTSPTGSVNTPTGPVSMGPLSMSSLHQSPSLSPNSSLIMTSTPTIAAGSVSVSGQTTMAVSNDVAELQQQIHNLRLAMKQLAVKNIELKTMLTSHKETIQWKENGDVIKVRPKWYMDSIRRRQRAQFNAAGSEVKFQEFRSKLQKLKIDLMNYKCSTEIMLPDLDQITINRDKPGWSRCIGDVIRKQQQQRKLTEFSFEMRYRQLCAEFEQFIRQLDEGFSCDSSFVSFIAPHISKIILSEPELMAKIKIGSSQTSSSQSKRSIVPVEVTIDDLNRIYYSMLLY